MKKVNLIVSSQTEAKDAYARGVELGRYWKHQAYYLYPLSWDPFILTRLEAIPALREPTEPLAATENSLLFFTHSNTAEDGPVIDDVLDKGGNVVLNHPSPEIEQRVAGEGFCSHDFGETIISLRERWHFSALATRSYIYPHMQPFLRLDPQSGRVLTHIGGNPDLILGKRAAIFAGDPIQAVGSYQFTPHLLTGLMGDLTELLVLTVAHFTETPMTSSEQSRLRQRFELRRDFHSFGYAHWMVGELDRCYGGGKVDLQEAEKLVMAAAEKAVRSGVRDATDLLKEAFEALERENRKIQPIPAVFTDVLHGGELFDDIGYFEIDWPEHPADVMRIYLQWVKTRSYRFNVDLGATTVRELAKRFPDLFAELKKQHGRGRVEFVNGSCNQPYPPFHSLESQIRQFDVGRQVWRDVFDTHPKTYASQEFGFCPQMASVLKQQGYDNAVVRVQNMGDAPTLRHEQIEWEAPNGDRLRSLPSHPHKSESQDGNDYTYHNLHLKLYLSRQDGLPFAVFTCLGDITFNRWMREELARVCHYAPVFGRFDTMGSYFKRTKKVEAPATRFAMQDFNCDAVFINLDAWQMYKNYTGNYNSNCVNSMRSTHLFAAAELIDATAAVMDRGSCQTTDHDKNWEALTHYQGHGTYIVPYHQAGGFQGPGPNPENDDAGRGVQHVTEYLGPIDFRQVKQVTDKLMEEGHTRARERISTRLSGTSASAEGKTGYCMYNYAQARPKVVRLPEAAGRNFEQTGQLLFAQDDGPDRLVSVTLPAYGYALVTETPSGVSGVTGETVTVAEDCLENQFLRLEFDLPSGTLRRAIDKTNGRDLLTANSHAFYFPQSSRQVCRQSQIRLQGPLRGSITFNIELADDSGNRCTMETVVSLDAIQAVATFATKVLEVPGVEGNQWSNHLGVQFQFPDAGTEILASHFNVLEPFSHNQIFSPNVLVTRSEAGDTVFLNEGNQFYVRDGQSLRHIMIMENELLREFRYAVGAAKNNPIMQSLKWSQPCFIQKTKTRNGLEHANQSLIDLGNENIELLSCRYDQGTLLVRLANTAGVPAKATLSVFQPVTSASMTGLDGKPGRSLKVSDGRIKLNLRPWDIRQVRMTL